MPASSSFEELIAQSPLGEDGPSGPALVAALRRSGLLAAAAALAHHPANPSDLLEVLTMVGRASLSAGRLFEGHVNAVKLVKLHGGDQAAALLRQVADGAIFGIWGADSRDPARLRDGRFAGQKIFASGADVLDAVIVTALEEDQPRLFFFTRDQLKGRLFPEEWQVSGMKATASGRCNLDGLSVTDAIPLGNAGAYLIEPHFQGGVWRYAAVQLGAMQALASITATQLRQRGQADAPLQSMRLRRMLTACETARLWVRNAAHVMERPEATAADTPSAILARMVVADEAVALLTAMDQALGAASFATVHPADRIRRDLQFYIRQANPDGMAQGAMERILADPDLSKRWWLG